MMAVAEEKELYLEQQVWLEKQPTSKASPFKDLRQAASSCFEELDFPTTRNEDWKFTNVAPLLKVPFALAPTTPVTSNLRKRLAVEELPSAIRLVFVNGSFAPDLSRLSPVPAGVIVGNLAAQGENNLQQLRPYLGKLADHSEHVFTALNTSFLRDGAFIFIPKGLVLSEPIQLVFASVADEAATVSHPRVLVVAGVNSQASVMETYLAGADGTYFTNAVTEIVLEENAILDHYKVQRDSPAAFHIASTQVHQGRSSNFCSHYVSLGGRLVRNETRVLFTDEGGEATLNGLYLAGGSQHIDNHTVIDHARPHCTSHELYKGILDGKAHGVFNGKIFVRQDAQKTDAKQTNKVLLLSEDATINTKPQLEIFADDVKCTHGATVGQLDTESIFYLRSRGIGLEEARNLLTYAFANDVIDRIKVEAVREQLERLLTSRPFGREECLPSEESP